MRRPAACAVGLAWTVLLATAAGCVSAPAAESRRPDTAHDACAERLHEVCGQILVFYARRHRLPATIDELKTAVREPLVCPVSGEAYMYRPEGIPIDARRPDRLILFDASPAHAGARWGIVIIEPKGPGPLVTQVLPLKGEPAPK